MQRKEGAEISVIAFRSTLLIIMICAQAVTARACAVPQSTLPAAPYELKGDQLGMSLTDFKTKHYHLPEGDPKCSDDYPPPQHAVVAIEVKYPPGVVACKIFFPFEERPVPKTTIANVPVSYQVFYFVDGKLFKIEIIFNEKDFEVVRAAFEDKYHSPAKSETKNYQNGFGASFEGKNLTWQNDASIIIMRQFGVDLTRSTIVFLHTALAKEAEARAPKQKPDL